MDFQIVAIDGPSGSGKSTIARLLAKEKFFLYVDTGAMFRCLAHAWKAAGLDESEETLKQLAHETHIRFAPDGKIYCNATEVTQAIRQEEISQLASQMSQFPLIRQSMKQQQRQIVQEAKTVGVYKGVVLEGRDIGTVVLPHATFKFFLDGNNETRAKRRHEQLVQQGQDVAYEKILQALQARDAQDRNREHAPLVVAEGAFRIDSTHLSIPQVLEAMNNHMA